MCCNSIINLLNIRDFPYPRWSQSPLSRVVASRRYREYPEIQTNWGLSLFGLAKNYTEMM